MDGAGAAERPVAAGTDGDDPEGCPVARPCPEPDEDCAFCWSAAYGLRLSGAASPLRAHRRGAAELWTPDERARLLHRRLPGSTTPVRCWAGADLLRGRHLRYVLLVVLMRGGAMSVAELVAAVEARGHRIGGRPGKVVSDALRWERRRGRVVLLGRGRYRVGTMSRQVMRRMGDRVAALEAERLVADAGGDGRLDDTDSPDDAALTVPRVGSRPLGPPVDGRPPIGIGSRWMVG